MGSGSGVRRLVRTGLCFGMGYGAIEECHNGYQSRSTGVSGVMRGKIGGTDLIGAERCGKAYDGVNCSHDMGQRCGYLLPVAPCTE